MGCEFSARAIRRRWGSVRQGWGSRCLSLGFESLVDV